LCDFAAIQKKEAAYDFLAFMANKKNAFFNVTNGWTGVQPAMKYEYFAPVGTGRVEEWENQGWDKDDAIAYLNAYYANLLLPAQQIYLRIPGAADYWRELDLRISSVLSGAKKPKEALDDIIKPGNESPIGAAERFRKNFMRTPMLSSPLPAGSASDRRTVD
jgi:ABC-type glycerol-3-phosphate transport system substrate-binding protein